MLIEPLRRPARHPLPPQTESYWELWIDGERRSAPRPTPLPQPGPQAHDEPIYGDLYLPRKFKIGVAWPGDNCIDVLTNDVGIVPTLEREARRRADRIRRLVGGGLGRSHAREEDTYPRLAEPLGWVAPDRVVDVVEAVVAIQRDFGNRDDRQRARLKYLVDERGGLGAAEVGGGSGSRSTPRSTCRRGSPSSTRHRTASSACPSQRTRARPRRRIPPHGAAEWPPTAPAPSCGHPPPGPPVARPRPRPHGEVEERLRAHGVAAGRRRQPLRRLAIACPALPTCGQALAEAERVMPDVVDTSSRRPWPTWATRRAIQLNMTGCPNGCARPYTAEIGISGGPRDYDVYVGGSTGGDRLAVPVREDVRLDQIAAVLAPVFAALRRPRRARDHVRRLGRPTSAVPRSRPWLPEPGAPAERARPLRPWRTDGSIPSGRRRRPRRRRSR